MTKRAWSHDLCKHSLFLVKEVLELSRLALFYKCVGKYQHYECNTVIPELCPPGWAKGVSSLEMNTVTRDAYLKDQSSFNKRKKSKTKHCLWKSHPTFATFSSIFMTALWTPSLYRKYHFITLNKCQKMLWYTQKIHWSLVFVPKSTQDNPSLLAKNKKTNKNASNKNK